VARGLVRAHQVLPTKVVEIPPATTTFSFAVPSFEITTTRALFSDTDFATLGIVVTDQSGNELNTYGPTTVSLGDLGNGSHSLGMLGSSVRWRAGSSPVRVTRRRQPTMTPTHSRHRTRFPSGNRPLVL
jgi:hypothetical protein